MADQAAHHVGSDQNRTRCRIGDDAQVGADQAASVSAARDTATDRAVLDRAKVVADQCTKVSTGTVDPVVDIDIGQRHMRDAPARSHYAEQSYIVEQLSLDAQLVDAVAQAREGAAEGGDLIAKPVKAGTGVPAGGGGGSGSGIDVGAERIVAGQVAINALQIGSRDAARAAEVVDDVERLDQTVGTLLRAEVVAGGQIDLGASADGVTAGVADSDGTLAELQRQRGAAGACHVGVDVDVVLCVQGQLVGAPRHRVVDMDIAIAGGGAVRAQDDRVGSEQRGGQCAASHVATGGGYREIDRIDQPLARLALGRFGADAEAVGHLDMRGRSFDEAAIAAMRRRRIERAADDGRAALHVAQQDDLAAAVVDGLRLDHALVVDHRLRQLVERVGGQEDAPAVGLDQALVGDQRVEGALVDGKAGQSGIIDFQSDLVGGRQADVAFLRRDAAFIDHLGADQHHVTAGGGIDLAPVDDAAAARAGQAETPGGKVVVRHVAGRGEDAGRADLGPGCEQHAVRIDDEDLAIGVQRAQDLRRILPQHAVQRDGGRRRLDELDAGGAADIETLPVDRRLAAGLADRQGIAALTDLRLAERHLGAAGQRVRPRAGGHDRSGQRDAGQHAGQQRARGARRFAAAARGFCHDDVRTKVLAPDLAVDAVHLNLLCNCWVSRRGAWNNPYCHTEISQE